VIGAEVIGALTHNFVQMFNLLICILCELIWKLVDCTLCVIAIGSFYRGCLPKILFCRYVHDAETKRVLNQIEENEARFNSKNINKSRNRWLRVKSVIAAGSFWSGEELIYENDNLKSCGPIYFLGIDGKKVKDARNPATIKYQDVCEKVYGSMQEDIDTWKSGKFDKLQESLKLHKEDLQAFYGVYKELKHRLKNETKDNTNFLVFPTLTEFVQVCMDANPTPVESGNCDTKIKYNAQLIRQRTRLRMCFVLVLIAFMMCLFFLAH